MDAHELFGNDALNLNHWEPRQTQVVPQLFSVRYGNVEKSRKYGDESAPGIGAFLVVRVNESRMRF